MTANYAPNAAGLIANQQYRGATWGPNVSVPIAANHSYNVNPQIRYASFTGLTPFPATYATHPVVSKVFNNRIIYCSTDFREEAKKHS